MAREPMDKKEREAWRERRRVRRAAGKIRPLTEERKQLLRTKYVGGSRYGRDRNMVCPVCGQCYDKMRTGYTFDQVRRDIIAIGWCTKRNRVKNGRRSGVLGYMHELKMQMWRGHLLECEKAAPTSKALKQIKRAIERADKDE